MQGLAAPAAQAVVCGRGAQRYDGGMNFVAFPSVAWRKDELIP
jgi:hypothetical protein